MPKPVEKETPPGLKSYLFHGLALSYREGDSDAMGDCPFCDREGKFGVDVVEGVGHCVVCSESVNTTSFLRKLWERSYEGTPPEAYAKLAADRKLLEPESLVRWEFAVSYLSGDWILPGYSAEGNPVNLYRWARMADRRAWLATPIPKGRPGHGHKWVGYHLFDPTRRTTYIVEGVWDALALWEVLRKARADGDWFLHTGNEEASLLADANVFPIPACEVFFDTWASRIAGGSREVVLLPQNDHPRTEANGRVIPSASYNGMRKVARKLVAAGMESDALRVLSWAEGAEAASHDAGRPHGYDVRDYFTEDGASQ